MSKHHHRFIAASLPHNGCIYQLSNSSGKVLAILLKKEKWLSYVELIRYTKLPRQSLYVFVSRLRKAGLVQRTTAAILQPDKHYLCDVVVIRATRGTVIHQSKYVG